MGTIVISKFALDLVAAVRLCWRWLQRLVWLGYVTMYLEHQNSAISAEAWLREQIYCGRGRRSIRCTHFCLNRAIPVECRRDVSKHAKLLQSLGDCSGGSTDFLHTGVAQNARPQQSEAAKDQKATAAPAPFMTISGTWAPANGPGDGIQLTA